MVWIHSVVDRTTTVAMTVVMTVLLVRIASGMNVHSGKKGPRTVVNGQNHLLAVPTTMIVAPGLHLLAGGIMKRENLQGTMIIGGEVMMTAKPLITIMTAAGMITTIGDATIVAAGARKKTIGTTTGR